MFAQIRFHRFITLALALSFAAGAQAQYAYPSGGSYPSVAASSGHAARINPIQAGGSIANRPGIGQSRAGIGSNMQGNGAPGSFGYEYGQSGQNITTPDGSAMGQQPITGPNGQTIGQQDNGGKYGTYGQQQGAGYGYGASYSHSSGTMTRSGSAPGMANGKAPHFNNGGTAGASEQAGTPDSFGEWVHRQRSDSDPNQVSTTTSDNGTLVWHGDQKWSGTDAQGLTWKNGKPWNGPDGNGGSYQNGHHIPGMPNQDFADMGGTYGPGAVVNNGTGQVVHPGPPGRTPAAD